ncbi:threonine synthase [Terribacillus saccharophilus]|uniref:Threonine synthase n=1 Tax=Terribacillus saccharophilus TaxID=361277 RepID=A0A268AFM4_9BACI|nr:threonine synthase [Terribacillus saccharophilus]PAD22929.1 threonine synthase [Terribacillus saccharophilus]PAF17971.1 threonine synthase [Terribacillus saccharophilus]PAF22885.1 threonine synthase [Terribacillus saccharophilus]PAF37508.1 threonine synthase [Terribacillus saccharophilus]
MGWKGLLEAYKEYLPISEETPAVSLGEGNTPLVKLEKLSAAYGIEAYAKIEGANPTGSFKDRGMVMAIAKAKEAGAKAVICASTGNTSASAAAYAARAGMRCFVVIPEGKIAQGKLAQAVMYGAEIFSIEGNFDDALRVVRNLSETEPVALVNSVNPYRLEGQKTAAFELCEQLGQAPDYLFIPVGNAGNISAYWKGFKEYEVEKGYSLPVLKGYQASGAAPIVHDRVFENPETVGTAIRIGNPASWQKATAARDESGGTIDEVTDEQIIAAYQKIAREEGIFAEPGSCASFAGLLKALKQGEVRKGATVVSVLTGNGLKDPNTAIEYSTIQPVVLPNEEQVIADAIRERM